MVESVVNEELRGMALFAHAHSNSRSFGGGLNSHVIAAGLLTLSACAIRLR